MAHITSLGELPHNAEDFEDIKKELDPLTQKAKQPIPYVFDPNYTSVVHVCSANLSVEKERKEYEAVVTKFLSGGDVPVQLRWEQFGTAPNGATVVAFCWVEYILKDEAERLSMKLKT